MISVNTSNTIADCDNLFLLDFIKLDQAVAKLEKQKHENMEYMIQNMQNIIGGV